MAWINKKDVECIIFGDADRRSYAFCLFLGRFYILVLAIGFGITENRKDAYNQVIK